jgi:hypothetical protein
MCNINTVYSYRKFNRELSGYSLFYSFLLYFLSICYIAGILESLHQRGMCVSSSQCDDKNKNFDFCLFIFFCVVLAAACAFSNSEPITFAPPEHTVKVAEADKIRLN